MLIQFMNQCLWWMLYIDFIFNHLLKKETTFLFVTIKYTNQDWKCHQFINYGNNIEKKHWNILERDSFFLRMENQVNYIINEIKVQDWNL